MSLNSKFNLEKKNENQDIIWFSIEKIQQHKKLKTNSNQRIVHDCSDPWDGGIELNHLWIYDR